MKSTSGTLSKTDSLGHYEIVVKDNDSITFVYNNKPTAAFAVRNIDILTNFDISLHIRVNSRFKLLKEVRVYTKTYREDSLENRENYSSIFNYEKPTINSSMDAYTGGVGLDLDEFINMFRFKRNKMLHSVQLRLLQEEQEKYIDYRFNKALVKRITRLDGAQLDVFMKLYRPDFEFTQKSSTVDFYQYILNSSYAFKRQILMQQGNKNP